jgi:hypothetical protein
LGTGDPRSYRCKCKTRRGSPDAPCVLT